MMVYMDDINMVCLRVKKLFLDVNKGRKVFAELKRI